MGIFSFTQYVGVALLVSGFISEVTFSCVAIHSVCLWEEGNSEASYAAILVDPPAKFYIVVVLPIH